MPSWQALRLFPEVGVRILDWLSLEHKALFLTTPVCRWLGQLARGLVRGKPFRVKGIECSFTQPGTLWVPNDPGKEHWIRTLSLVLHSLKSGGDICSVGNGEFIRCAFEN